MTHDVEDSGPEITASAHPVLILDSQGRISDASPAACSFLGSTREGLLLHPLGAFVATPRVEDLQDALRSLPQDAEVHFRTELKRGDGSSRQVRLRVSSHPAQAGITLRLGHDRRASDRFGEAPDFAKAVLETSESPVLVLSGEDRIVFANRACEALTGLASGELRGRPPWGYFRDPEEGERAKRAVASLRSGKPASLRESWIWRRKDGELRAVTWKLSLFQWIGNGRTYILATGVDFTEPERKVVESHRAQADVRSALERIRSVVDSVPALISYLDTDGKYLFANRRYQEWFGIPESQIEGRRVQEIVPRNIYEVLRPHLDRAFLGETVSFEMTLWNDATQPRWVEATYIPDRDAEGKVRGVFGQVQDVSKLRRLINAVFEHQMHLQAIMDHAPLAITLVDNDDRFLMVDRQFEALLGADRKSLIGQSIREAFPPQIAERILKENEVVRRSR
ncbi:MAG TPA: PAS domain S-box protein, partial [Planctomycetota bacterium]|nr:PAS domain S-box protein [Planctomycetota bacterium]